MMISQEIISVLDYIGQKIGVTIDWTSQNVMPYLQDLFNRFIKYEIATSIAWLVFVVALFILGIIFSKWCFKMAEDSQYCCGEWIGFGIVVIVIVSVIFIYTSIVQIGDIIACLTIPEKILINEIEYMISTMK